ncbi:tripartite tricarboxylate transporter TctB family protein [Marinomonas sp. 15G1-11]|uniref:Tripartite tricarboxylate transporter TctB family protein n=1 Tax=Marinomonas phaeophyticola TaxID=3004091 RepID=A0ABT4JRV2_9GAMM|nr:tripartite tricarboxylate transporter TctB family protein [Marinomonas sp. 15G1-11]MCZ2720752.1 tripartite tricarboxylate transporter TctB family protein [Marinomonas sp. 15G1-11]
MFNRDIVFPVLIIIFSATVLALIPQFSIPSYGQQDASVGAKFFPTVLAILQIIICIALLAQRKIKQLKTTASASIFSKMSLFGLGFLIAYAVLISFLGYLIASLIMFTLYLIFLKTKKASYYLFAYFFVVVIYYLFSQVFLISLPEGIL